MRVKPKIFGLWQGICLVFIFASLAFAASYRNTVSLTISGASRSIVTTNATNGTAFNSTNDTINLSTGLNFFNKDSVLSVSVTNNYSETAKVYILLSVGGTKNWLYNNCTLDSSPSCQINFQTFANFTADFQNSTKMFSTIPARTTMPVLSLSVGENVHSEDPITFWVFSFVTDDDNLTHLIGMDSKTLFLHPDFGNIEYH